MVYRLMTTSNDKEQIIVIVGAVPVPYLYVRLRYQY